MNYILGTAGHIDHGKTTLVSALTGIDCDRLNEEKKRGITIELGFAWMDLPDGQRLGIVDVPGHERFIKNMVAGAAGVDFILLVVAADEGVMPQTREHLEICSLLGIHSGIVVLTKIDMVDEEWLKAVEAKVREALSGSFLANAPIVPVSSSSGAGLDRLREEIYRQVAKMESEPKCDIFRLPIDRVFSMKGFGTVVTGTIISGQCIPGEKLCVLPSGKQARVRNLQVHNDPVELAHEGQRCAVNLQGLEVEDIERGDVAAKPDTLFPSTRWFISLTCLKSAPLPIRQRSEVHFHHGTRECMAKIIFQDRDKLEPGKSAIAEVKFEQGLTAVFGDHCVLRSHSPLVTIGGGVVIDPLPPLLIKRQPDYEEKLDLLQKLGEFATGHKVAHDKKSALQLLLISLALWPLPGTDLAHLQVLTGLARQNLLTCMQELEKKGEVFCWDRPNGMWIHKNGLQFCMENCRKRAEELHKREPVRSSFPANAIIAGWGMDLPQKFIQEILGQAVKNNILAQEGSGFKLAGHQVSLDDKSSKMIRILLKKINANRRTPPSIKEIAEECGWDMKKVQPLLNHLCESGQLLKIQENLYYNREEFLKMTDLVRKWFASHEELDIANLKEILGLSRKYAIPVLEYLDSSQVTYRVENMRRLRKN